MLEDCPYCGELFGIRTDLNDHINFNHSGSSIQRGKWDNGKYLFYTYVS